jgi:hypothetical protein
MSEHCAPRECYRADLNCSGGHPALRPRPRGATPLGLLIEESKTNVISISNTFTRSVWGIARATVTNSTDFPIFASGDVFQLIGNNGQPGTRGLFRIVSTSSRTFSVYLRRGTNNFVQVLTDGDNIVFANYNLLTGVVGSRGVGIITTTMTRHCNKNGYNL